MQISDEQREFFTQKNPAETYDTVTFTHSEFTSPVRLILNQFKTFTFNNNEYVPVAASIQLPDQGSDLTPKVTIQFSRIHVGDEFKKVLNEITPFGWQEPIKMIYEQYSELSKDTPLVRYSLYVTDDGIKFNREGVEISASDDNPMILAKPYGENNPIYTTEDYRGLDDV